MTAVTTPGTVWFVCVGAGPGDPDLLTDKARDLIARAGAILYGIKLRDATSFGLPGWVRVSVQPPASQQALAAAWSRV